MFTRIRIHMQLYPLGFPSLSTVYVNVPNTFPWLKAFRKQETWLYHPQHRSILGQWPFALRRSPLPPPSLPPHSWHHTASILMVPSPSAPHFSSTCWRVRGEGKALSSVSGNVLCFWKRPRILQGLQVDSFRKQPDPHCDHHMTGDGQFPLQGSVCHGSYWTPIAYGQPCDCIQGGHLWFKVKIRHWRIRLSEVLSALITYGYSSFLPWVTSEVRGKGGSGKDPLWPLLSHWTGTVCHLLSLHMEQAQCPGVFLENTQLNPNVSM